MSDIINAVVAEMTRRAFTAVNEFPGVVCLMETPTRVFAHGDVLISGNANDVWCVDLVTSTGEVVESWRTDVPRESTDVNAICDAITKIIVDAVPS